MSNKVFDNRFLNDRFSVEEVNLLCIFNATSRAGVLSELRGSIGGIYEPEMRDVFESTILKLESITDAEFEEIGLYIADEYDGYDGYGENENDLTPERRAGIAD